MRSIKIIFFIMLFILTLFFIFQNTAVMQITFLFWSVSMSACLILLITFFSGFILGGLVELLKVRKKGGESRRCLSKIG